VSSLGELCPDPAGMYCRSWEEEYEDEIEAEKGVLRTTQASVLALDIQADGSLSAPRTVLGGLPIVTIGHSPNGLALGGDGRLYLAIGNLDKSFEAYFEAPDEFVAEHADLALLGTILSFNPDGSDPQVYATGFRNVYDLAFDRTGRLFAADNDGPTVHGPMFDEINLVLEGLFYGYPEYGSFTPEADRVETPLWVITDGVGISGLESSDQIGYRSGVFVGQTGRMLYIRFEVENDRVYVFEYNRTLIQAEAIFTVIDADRAGHLFVGLFLQQGENRLLVLEDGRE
jgi:glucose/arabinose dehydrogenase